MAKSTRGVRPGRKHPSTTMAPGSFQSVWQHPPAPDLSRDARRRLVMLDWHRAHGENVSRTARHFGYSRPTVYRWLRRFERDRLETLEDRPLGAASTTASDLDARPAAGGQGRPRAVPALGQGQAGRPASAAGGVAVDLDGRPDPWPAASLGRAARAAASSDERPPATLASTVCHPQAGRLDGRATGRPGRARHARHPAPVHARLEAVHRPRRRQSLGHRRTRSASDRRRRDRRARSAGRADALPGPGHQHRQRLRVHGRVRDRLPGAGHPPVRPAAALAQAPRRGRARQPHPHRGVLRDHQRRARARGVPGRPAGMGDGVQHRFAPTSRWAISLQPSTWPPSGSMCNGRTGRVQALDASDETCPYSADITNSGL